MKKFLITLSLLLTGFYLTEALNINLSSGDKLDSTNWNNINSISSKINLDNNNLNINGKLVTSSKICIGENCIGECSGGKIWDEGTSSCITPTGGSAENPGKTCKTILDENPLETSGIKWIDPDGEGGNTSFQAYCDMDLAGGGWTLLATQTEPNYFTTSNVDNYTASGIGPDAGLYSILGKADLFTSNTYSGQYEFLYRDNVDGEDRWVKVKQNNKLVTTSSSGCSVLEYSVVSPNMVVFDCFYTMQGGSQASYNKYATYRSNWQFGFGQYKDRNGYGLITGAWNDGKSYASSGSTKYEFYVR